MQEPSRKFSPGHTGRHIFSRTFTAGNYIVSDPVYEGHHGIYLCELDPETFQFKGERTVIWNGLKSRSKWIEAPHIYKHDGWYYLIVAEGGTFTNHSVMMARCRTIDGDYDICPRNPSSVTGICP